jgi:aminocarboxymuconate-semialdehyde decarboxylase
MTEGSELPPGWREWIEKASVERLIVPCPHNAEAFRRGGVTCPIHVIPGGTDPDEFPILHGGGFFPYHLGRFDQGWAVRAGARAANAKMAPSSYLKNIYYDNMIYRLDTIKYLIGLGGIDHIMVGTDYPYDLGDWDAAKKVEQLDIPEADKMLMLEGNAKKLLRIK